MIKRLLKDNYIYILIIIALIISFYFVYNSTFYLKILQFDNKIMSIKNIFVTDYGVYFFKIFTFLGGIYIPLLIIVCILSSKENIDIKLLFTCSYCLSGVFAYIIKILINRPRPINGLIPYPDQYSFPSGHTLTSIVIYLLLAYIVMRYNKRGLLYMIITIIIVFLIGVSRIYLGVHYFSDVIGGVLIGIPLLMMFINIYNKEIKVKC